MSRFSLLLAALLLSAGLATAQPVKQWQRTYVYPHYNKGATDFIRLSGNRLLEVGYGITGTGTEDSVGKAAGLWFYNNQGDTLHTQYHFRSRNIVSQQLGEPDYRYYNVVQAPEGDLLLGGYRYAGTTQGVQYTNTEFFTRTDSTGSIIRWTRYGIGGPGSLGIVKTLALPDGGLLALYAVEAPQAPGQGVPMAAALRLDSLGNVLWRRTYGRAYSLLQRIVPLPDGSYALAGYYPQPIPGTSLIGADAWLLNITASGDTVRSRRFGTPADGDYFYDAQPAPGGGVLLLGGIRSGTVANRFQSWLLAVDSLSRPRWQQRLPGAYTSTTPNYSLYQVRALAGGKALVSGIRLLPSSLNQSQDQVMAVYEPTPAGGAQVVWERFIPPSTEPNYALDFDAAGQATFSGYTMDAAQNSYTALARFQLSERPYVPNLCQTPPQASLGITPTPTGDSLRFVSLSGAGPQYAQLVRWRWDFGDGTRYDGPTPRPTAMPLAAGPASPCASPSPTTWAA